MDQSSCKGVRLRPIQTKFEKRVSDISSKDESQERNGRDDDDDDDQPLSPAGQIFYEPNMNVHSLAIFGCKTKIDPAVIRANLPLTLLKHSSRFCSFPVTMHLIITNHNLIYCVINASNHYVHPG